VQLDAVGALGRRGDGYGLQLFVQHVDRSRLVILLLRRKMDRGTPPVPWMTALTEPGLARALQAILERPSERFAVEILASIAGMSRSAFAARFTRAFGQTPMNLLRSARLRRARELLATMDIPVSQIAHNVGFSNASNFSHAFRTTYGVDPTMFRAVSFENSEPDLNEHRG
jgi:AraC family transcriptional activator of mtrCDE